MGLTKFHRTILAVFLFISHIFSQTPVVKINEFLASNGHINYDPNFMELSDWIELHNKEPFAINLNGYYLTDNLSSPYKWKIEKNLMVEANGYAMIWADGNDVENHTNFKLSKDGEQIGLYSPDGNLIDSIVYNIQKTDISFGRNPNDENEWLYFNTPTPNHPNISRGFSNLISCEPPVFSIEGGFYQNNLMVTITSNPNTEVRYTLDCSEPNENSPIYSMPINIYDKSGDPNYFSEIPTNVNPYSWIQPWQSPISTVHKATIVRAKVFAPNKVPSDIATHAYFLGPELSNAYNTLPVISLISDEKHLFSDSSGIYVPGVSYEDRQGTGNYFNDWNRPANITFFDQNGDLQFSQEVEIRTQGRTSQANPQKGLQIIASSKYGKDNIDYPFFKNCSSKANKLTSLKRFMLRAWGSNWQYAMFSDAFAHSIYSKSSLDIQDYKPAVVFINGEYWGLHEIREANKNPYYFQEHYGIDRDRPGIDIIAGGFNKYDIDEGDDVHWKNMVDFIINNDLSVGKNYDYLKTQMDIDNFIDYIGHTVYCGKYDWPGQNEAFWRPKTSDGRWKWIQYDMDTSFGLHGGIGAEYDMISHVLNGGFNNQGAHPILKSLIVNPDFKNKFINWFMDRFNYEFSYSVTKSTLNNMVDELSPYIDEHRARWALRDDYYWLNWYYNIGLINSYLENKQHLLIKHLQKEFNLGTVVPITLHHNKSYGSITLNSLNITDSVWGGSYFEDFPIKLTAKSISGYQFDYWEYSYTTVPDSTLIVFPENNLNINVVFSPVNKIDSLYINEVFKFDSTASKDSHDSVKNICEFYNASSDTVKFPWFFLTDDFTIPTKYSLGGVNANTINIPPKDFFVVQPEHLSENGCNVNTNFLALFQLSGKDTVLIDSVSRPSIFSNISYGRFPDGSENWYQLLNPTPGGKNMHSPSSGEINNRSVLLQNYPNPFNVFSNITVYLIDDKPCHISIFDIKGTLLRKINLEPKKGYQVILWEGTDANNKQVPSGIYFYSLYSDDLLHTKKLLLLK